MANFNGDNYALVNVNRPSEKVEKGEVAGRKRLLMEKMTLSSVLSPGDKILGLKLPGNSLVIDAKIRIDKSLGVTGIFDLGHEASAVDAADANAFVTAADAGGQASLQRAGASEVGIMKRFAEEVQIIATCTEIMDGSVLDAVIYLEVEYVND